MLINGRIKIRRGAEKGDRLLYSGLAIFFLSVQIPQP